jgi:hypothetical protein
MRICYGDIFEFELEKVGAREISFVIFNQNLKNPFVSFHGTYGFSLLRAAVPELTSTNIYICGSNKDYYATKVKKHYPDEKTRDIKYSDILATLKQWLTTLDWEENFYPEQEQLELW